MKPSALAYGIRDRRRGLATMLRTGRARFLVAAFLLLLILTATSQASTEVVGEFEFRGEALCDNAGCTPNGPRSFARTTAGAVNADGSGAAAPGDLYVLDGGDRGSFVLGALGRVQQFSALDGFIRLWGPGVVKSGPGNANEVQAVMVDATAGTFKLGFGSSTTGDIPVSATAEQVESALNGLASVGAGGVSVSGGPGDAGGTSPYLVTFGGGTLAGGQQPLLKASSGSNPLSGAGASVRAYTTREGDVGFEVCRPAEGDECSYSNGGVVVNRGHSELSGGPLGLTSITSQLAGALFSPRDLAIDQASGDLYLSNRNRVEAYSATGEFLRAWGQDVVAAGPADSAGADEQKRVTVTADGGTFRLAFRRDSAAQSFGQTESTATIPYGAPASAVETAINDLAEIAGSYSSVSVGGPDGGPYLITFQGLLGGDDLDEVLSVNISGLTGAKSSQVETVVDGGGYEVCGPTDACKGGIKGDSGGAFGFSFEERSPPSLAVAPAGAPNAGNVLAVDNENGRVQEFTPAGTFVRAFGWDVDADNPSTGFEVCTGEAGSTCQAGTRGGGPGQFRSPQAIAEDSSGAIYASEPSSGGRNRVQKFVPAGGADLTPSLFGSTEIQALAVDATSGQFRLSFEGQVTGDIPAGASAGAVQSALNSLSSVGSEGGSVEVTGSAPYLITFNGGPLALTDPPEMETTAGSTPLSGGTATATVTTETPGGPNGLLPRAEAFDLGVAAGDRVLFSKYFPAGFSRCVNGSPSPAEIGIQELSPSGAVLGTSNPCGGLAQSFDQLSGFNPNLTVNPSTGRSYLLPGKGFADRDEGFTLHSLYVFGPAGLPPMLTLDQVSGIAATAGTISGSINPNGPGTSYPDVTGNLAKAKTTYRVEFKRSVDSTWTKYSPDAPIGSGISPVPFSVGVGGLEPNTDYDLRVVATKPFTGSVEETRSFSTLPAAPEIEAFSSRNVTIDSADLLATINPWGSATTYRFEYGTTPSYGNSTTETSVGDAHTGQALQAHIEGLQDVVYHFRVVATSASGTTTSPDQTFTFHPPVCPNQAVRQQTAAAYLPDCRAYELVSPEDAGGTTLYTGGPQSAYATNPPRLAFVGQLASIPGAGRNPINTIGDLYVATRGAEGWRTRYVGPSSEEAGCVGGRPIASGTGFATTIQNDVMADPGLNRIIDWNLGNPIQCFSGSQGDTISFDFNTASRGSNAPYLWNANGDFLDRWPTATVDRPGSDENFACPQDPNLRPYPTGVQGNIPVSYFCSTHINASKDLSHFIFSTQSGLFGEGGITAAPGSAYDNDTKNNTLTLISKLPGGGSIGQEPTGKAGPEELIQFPSVSADGSHILMGIATKPACRQLDYPRSSNNEKLCPIITQPTHLYMRVGNAVTYDVSGKPVNYIGTTPDGNKVYFTSDEQLTGDDDDESTDLFMWNENGVSPQLTRVSVGTPSPSGNTDGCASTWTTDCDVKTYEDSRLTAATGNRGGLGSWDKSNPNPGYTDNAIAARSGDIYFYSPEQLVSGKGVPGKENIYAYRNGTVQFVAALEDDNYCLPTGVGGSVCSNGALGRLQVTPNGRFAAFITTSRITGYDNHGFAEMYRYDAETEEVVCVSCRPDGSAPESDVLGSEGGRFITDDGRVFFGTAEPLVFRDTNADIGAGGKREGQDIYEFVDGRPQLITTGTGTGAEEGSQVSVNSVPGLYGVSGDGVDVYFGTSDTLVGQDRNGSQLKFYDARTNGGFSFVPSPQPCAAADECRDPAAPTPAPLAKGTGASLAGGNASEAGKKQKKQARKQRKHKKRAQHRKAKAKRTAQRQKGGSR